MFRALIMNFDFFLGDFVRFFSYCSNFLRPWEEWADFVTGQKGFGRLPLDEKTRVVERRVTEPIDRQADPERHLGHPQPDGASPVFLGLPVRHRQPALTGAAWGELSSYSHSSRVAMDGLCCMLMISHADARCGGARARPPARGSRSVRFDRRVRSTEIRQADRRRGGDQKIPRCCARSCYRRGAGAMRRQAPGAVGGRKPGAGATPAFGWVGGP